jgi:hypothetical protein
LLNKALYIYIYIYIYLLGYLNLVSGFEGLCESTYFDRMYYGQDYWQGTGTIRSNGRRETVPWNHVSPSQIENYQKCKRSWFFKSILKIPEGQKGHQSLGEAFHLVMEKVPKGFSWPNHADVSASEEDWAKAEALARIALPLLPEDPSQVFKREWGIRLDTYEGGPTMIGYIDLGIPVGHGWPTFFIPPNEAIVADYKTLSDFRYMKTPQELASSVQMMTYAKWAIEPSGLAINSLPDYVRILHMYAKTRPPFTRHSIRFESAIVTPEEINLQWTKTLDTIREMDHVAKGCTKADEVEASGTTTGHCDAYGGCYFRDKCGLNPVSGIKSLFQIAKKPSNEATEPEIMSSILEKIKAARAAEEALKGSPAAPVADSSPSGTVVNSATGIGSIESVANPSKPSGPISGLLDKIQSQGRGSPALGGALATSYGKEIGSQAAGFAGSGELGRSACSTMADLLKLASGVIPPDAPPRTQEVITRPGDHLQNEEGKDDDDAEEDGSTVSATSAVLTSPSSNTGSIEPVRAKRGRPSNAEIEARKAEEAKRFDEAVKIQAKKMVEELYPRGISEDDLASQLARARAEVQSLGRRNAELASGRISDGLTLYIDCYPTKGEREITDYYEWIGPICAQVAAANSVGDWREIQYTARGLFANAIRETVKTGNNLPCALYISSAAAGAEIAVEVLTPIAKRIIKRM